VFCSAIAITAPAGAAAQVLEIGDGGAVTLHDRPAVFDLAGATPIEPPADEPPAKAVGPGAPVLSVLVEAAQANGLSPDLVEAVAWRESRLRAGVVSPAGAIGEMQLMPATARELGVDPYDTRQNLHGGARYLSGMMRRYRGDLVLALAAYNAGPGAVDRYRGVPPYRETREYVSAVLERLGQRAAAFAAPGR
jgi:soluble lytic murein transglycosylase-like protein